MIIKTSGKNHFRVKKGKFIITKPGEDSAHGTSCENLNYFWLNFTGKSVVEFIKNMNLDFYKIYNIGIYEEIRNCYTKWQGSFL